MLHCNVFCCFYERVLHCGDGGGYFLFFLLLFDRYAIRVSVDIPCRDGTGHVSHEHVKAAPLAHPGRAG